MSVVRILILFLAVLLPLRAGAVDVQRVTSPGGIEAWLVEDHSNPVVALRLAFLGGSELDPADRQGLANLAASTIDEGAGDLDSRAFQQILADEAITLRFDAGRDVFAGRVYALTETFGGAMNLLRLALTQPRFDAEPVERIRSQILSNIRSDGEDPDTVAFDALLAGLFPGHGYARRADGTEDTVKALTREDLHAFVRSRFARSNLRIGVSGDVTPERLAELLDKTFGGLPERPSVKPLLDIEPQATGRLRVIDMDVTQSALVMGHGAMKRDHPDYYAALVMNHVLGGGSFTSRLYDEVREKRGLAYSVGSSLYPLDAAGLIVASAGTENARVAETLTIIHEQWARMAAGEVTEQELRDAKTYLTGSFALHLTSTDAVATMLRAMQLSHLDIDYLDKRNGYIDAVTLDDVKRVAKAYLAPDKLDVVVVGRPEGVTERP
ncbi:MAG: insulinase family protein [Alphaproteobacteria bacterium]|nr:insulinase family protein [Alphaproteobacteria bacterium]